MIRLFFGDGEYDFSIDKIKHTSMLEGSVSRLARNSGMISENHDGFSLYDIYRRLAVINPPAEFISETLRIALIGGGNAPVVAARLIENYVEGCPFEGEGGPRITALAIVQSRIEEVIEKTKGLPKDTDAKKTEAATDQ